MRQEKTGTLRGTLYIVCVISLFTLPTKAIAGGGSVRATSTMDCDINCQLMRQQEIQQGNMCADQTYNLLHLEECLNKTLGNMMDGLMQLKQVEKRYDSPQNATPSANPNYNNNSNPSSKPKWVSIAYDKDREMHYYGLATSKEASKATAIDRCFFDGCKIVASFEATGWVAYIFTGSKWYVHSSYSTKEEAVQYAMNDCKVAQPKESCSVNLAFRI